MCRLYDMAFGADIRSSDGHRLPPVITYEEFQMFTQKM